MCCANLTSRSAAQKWPFQFSRCRKNKMSPQYCGRKHLHVLHETLIRGLQTQCGFEKQDNSKRNPRQWALRRGFKHLHVFAWRQSRFLHNAKVLLVSIFTQVASFIPGNVLQHAGSAACKHVTESRLIHTPAAGFARINDKKKKTATKCHSDIAERLQRQTCECCAEHAETLIQSARRPSWFWGRVAAATGPPTVTSYQHGNINIHNINNFCTVPSCCSGSDTNFWINSWQAFFLCKKM